MAIDGSLSLLDRDGAVLASTVLLLRPSASGPEVLLLKRNSNARNMADVWMFPGGKVDEDDRGTSELERVKTAAVRELEEEADVLLSVAALTHFSHWLTPAGMKRRFATWFFVAELPEGALVSVDGEEMVEARWVRPEDAVAEHQAGKLRLPPPTVVSLIDLSQHGSVDAAVATARCRIPPYFFPKVCSDDPEDVVMLYPGDAGYESGNRSVEGARHRAMWVDGVITYRRDFSFPDRDSL
ncbi:MAG: NUDIX hydrolase [Pseudomonadota bacterium]|nr:NUDIX hydrolase [Pseudomonadota bacterium]MEC7075443.1 NUDIX hydrolase [Pseudomonadota bacterium]MEC7491957.1 NUDIX hydrolase [Pseudomonadota bacterium]MEC7570317.1 NUDIX hydrolase [Pseudomonadota bacterium]MEC7993340.1 NUDIX hydrolase [Pseudomonadota bacterium]